MRRRPDPTALAFDFGEVDAKPAPEMTARTKYRGRKIEHTESCLTCDLCRFNPNHDIVCAEGHLERISHGGICKESVKAHSGRLVNIERFRRIALGIAAYHVPEGERAAYLRGFNRAVSGVPFVRDEEFAPESTADVMFYIGYVDGSVIGYGG